MSKTLGRPHNNFACGFFTFSTFQFADTCDMTKEKNDNLSCVPEKNAWKK